MDGVGKTTLMNALNKKTNWKYVVFDRGPVDTYTYDKMTGRGQGDTYFIPYKQMLPHTLTVIVRAHADTIKQRMAERGDDKLLPGTTVESNLEAFMEAYSEFKWIERSHIRQLDNTTLSVDYSCDKILEWIADIESDKTLSSTIEHSDFDMYFMPYEWENFCTTPPYSDYKRLDPRQWQYEESYTRTLIGNIYYDFVVGEIDKIVDKLSSIGNRDSRQCVINYSFMPRYDRNRDNFPCVYYSSHRIRGGELISTVHARSTDYDRGFKFDLAWNSWIHTTIAARLNVGQGLIRFTTDSLHRYI
jgi:thymidylate synthase